MEQELRRIAQVVGELFGEPNEADKVPVAELDDAEQRLGVKLPRALRGYYQLYGRNWVNGVQDCLRQPSELELRDGALVFFDENQGVCFWGIEAEYLSRDDPPVCNALNEALPLAWRAFEPQLSTFLLVMLFWHAVNGGNRSDLRCRQSVSSSAS